MSRKNPVLILAIVYLTMASSVFAQQSWSLEKCIQYAQTNSLNIKQAEIAVKQAQLTERGHLFSRLPDLNANLNGSLNSGLSLDPTTNRLEGQTSFSNSVSLSTGVLLFNGMRIKNSIAQSGIDIKAAQSDVDQTSYNLALDVAGAYLNILFAEEQLENAKKRLRQTEAQLAQTDRLIQAGILPQNDRLEILARIAQDEQAIVAQQNNLEISYLSLKQLLELEPNYNLKIEKPDIGVPPVSPEAFNLDEVYINALDNQPQIKGGELRLKSAEIGVEIAKAGLYPRISAFGQLDTRYFSKSKVEDITKWDFSNVRLEFGDPFPVQINGEPAELAELTTVGDPIIPNKNYFDQLKDFFGQTVGISASIPIYNNHQTKIAMEQAQLNIINTQVQNKLIKQQLKSEIQRAIADARAAKKTLDASQKTVESLQSAYQNTEKRYELGAVNTFELTTAKNNLDTAEVDLIIAKYDYIYKLKIVDFYQGNKISLK